MDSESQKPKERAKPQGYDFLTLKTGDVVIIKGVPCVLQHTNTGKRRLTFIPRDPKQHMPVDMSNPIRKVHRNERPQPKNP